MATAINKIVSNFPHPHLDPIVGQPSYETVHQLHLQLNLNAASIHSNLSDGELGVLQVTVLIKVYDTLSTAPFVESATITELNCAHDATTYLFNQYDSTDKALTQQIIGAIDATHLKTLRSKYSGFQNPSTRDILDHLYST
jgi:hypothetical protein